MASFFGGFEDSFFVFVVTRQDLRILEVVVILRGYESRLLKTGWSLRKGDGGYL